MLKVRIVCEVLERVKSCESSSSPRLVNDESIAVKLSNALSSLFPLPPSQLLLTARKYASSSAKICCKQTQPTPAQTSPCWEMYVVGWCWTACCLIDCSLMSSRHRTCPTFGARTPGIPWCQNTAYCNCRKSWIALRRGFTKILTEQKSLPLPEKSQVFKEPIDFKVLDKVPVPRGLLQIVQGRAEEYTKYILTEEDRTAVEWVWGPS